MIDIHAHILPNLDDGPPTIDVSLEMASVAAQDQVKCIVATPHDSVMGAALSQKQVVDGVEELNRALDEKGIKLCVLPGIEVYIHPMVAEHIRTGKTFTLNRSRYVLVELPFQLYPRFTDQAIFNLMVKGYTPVLAHPERCSAFQNDIGILYRMVERGVIAQMNAGSIEGDFGRRVQQTAEIMLEHNLVHVIASDAHSPETRPPVLTRAVECAARIVGHEQATAMVTTIPEALINNQAPRLPQPVPIKKKGWALWR